MYNLRSDLIHGRDKQQDADKILNDLSSLCKLLRKLWKLILSDHELMEILEEDDSIRERYFT